MEFVPILAIGALTKKLVDLIKAVRSKDWNAVLTLLVVAASGVVAVLVAAQTNWANSITLGELPLAQLSLASQIFVGVSVASFGALFGYDIPMQIDRSVTTSRRSLTTGKIEETEASRPA